VVDEIKAAGGEAVADTNSVATPEGGAAIVQTAIDAFGKVDVVINNAGILRDKSFTGMNPDLMNPVFDVHLKGAFHVSQPAFVRMKEQGYGRIVSTSSAAGIFGNFGQTNYGAAKMGIAAFTIISSLELGRYGVTVNAIAPAALTRMTENLGMGQASDEAKEQMSPRWIAPIATWLASTQSADVTGRVFEASGSVFAIAESWHRGPTATPVDDPTQIDALARKLLAEARPNADMAGQDRKG
jgi:NAD(P)-dependent dehydrogenase (short-subunit alcohol dehydrogenase family)